ncbi:hypothetical protein M9H77_27313 [Catharanthus roseus]|uniref:Uncharacterized protein n=1 Tax=Catharanthus roseus TaxID=4058 RepID=A0ACC0AE17_CATRO|nr:hypothetical protein M9H77_27313 [Catharanthus roseus]
MHCNEIKALYLYVPLVDVPFQEYVDIAETSRIDIDVQGIGTLVHESSELESVDIHGGGITLWMKMKIMKMKKRSNESLIKKEKGEEFQLQFDSKTYRMLN